LDFGAETNFIIRMGRTYLFECAKCAYRVTVAGGCESGRQLAVQTIQCLDCRELHDAVTAVKLPAPGSNLKHWKLKPTPFAPGPSEETPPKFADALNFLALGNSKRCRWMTYKLACPVSSRHRIRIWQQPGKCPKCGVFLEGSGTPFKVWD
jgi:hypothetical protein